jgi:hypothetical protein
MPYIKISDPNIIDLSSWHQVINVVNQHSDSITAITNNFGAQGTGYTDWNSSTDYAHEFDAGSQKIIYGRTKITFSTLDVIGDTYFLTGEIPFSNTTSGTSAFNATPVVTATLQAGYTGNNATDSNAVLSIYHLTKDSFYCRIANTRFASSVPTLSGSIYVNWIAVGPKG